MKLSIATVAAITALAPSAANADDRHVRFLDSAHLFPEANYHTSDTTDNLSSDRSTHGRTYGSAVVFPLFMRKIQRMAGIDAIDSSDAPAALANDAPFHEVQTLLLTKSSQYHVDRTRDGKPVTKSDGNVGFYVEKSTAEGSYFDTDDDELCIPIVEGSVVYFNGGLSHRTIVNSGSVKLIGPFLLSTLKSVGGSEPGMSAKAVKTPTAKSKKDGGSRRR